MRIGPGGWRRNVVLTGLAWSAFLLLAGCNDVTTNSGVAHPGNRQAATATDSITPPSASDAGAVSSGSSDRPAGDPTKAPQDAAVDSSRPRSFPNEGPDGALRITFDDLDLLKLINMDPVTSDCIERMPEWLRRLDGKRIRIRGFMKPSSLSTGLPQFLLVRSTDMCCFGPKGKVYHMIAVLLKPPTTTDYIELKPFDVTGKFRIETVELEPGTVFLLYHLDDAAIIRS